MVHFVYKLQYEGIRIYYTYVTCLATYLPSHKQETEKDSDFSDERRWRLSDLHFDDFAFGRS